MKNRAVHNDLFYTVYIQYLVLLCARGERVDLGAQLDKHLRYSADALMKGSVFIVLCTEVVLILLTLFQCCYGSVFTEEENIHRTYTYILFGTLFVKHFLILHML